MARMSNAAMLAAFSQLVNQAPAAAAPALPAFLQHLAVAVPKAAKVAAPKVAKAPLPLAWEIVTIHPDPAKGQTWEPFNALHVTNGRSGYAYRGQKLDARYLACILASGVTPEILSTYGKK